LTPEQQKQRVLVVDDETEAREQLSQSVTEVGCEVEQAQSAEEALELVRSADFGNQAYSHMVPGPPSHHVEQVW
jgi:CheY-like chemotaxis protein